VTSDAPAATVEVGGVPRCAVPCEVAVPAGRPEELTVVAPGYEPVVRQLDLSPGQGGELNLTLEETPEARSATELNVAVGLLGGGAVVGLLGGWIWSSGRVGSR